MAETLSTLSIISFVVAGVAFIIAVIFWFFFDILTVVGDLTGKAAKKNIVKMRVANEKSGAKMYKESRTNLERGKLTEAMHESKEWFQNINGKQETGLLVENRAETVNAGETSLLIDEEKTSSLERSVYVENRIGGKTLKIIEEIMIVHTDEVIEC